MNPAVAKLQKPCITASTWTNFAADPCTVKEDDDLAKFEPVLNFLLEVGQEHYRPVCGEL